jgi:hypothetical protein
VSRFIAHIPRGRRWSTLPTTAPIAMPMVSPNTSASVSAIAKVTASGCVTFVLERRCNVHTFVVHTGVPRSTLPRGFLGRKPRTSSFAFALIETCRWLGDNFPARSVGRKIVPALVLTGGCYSGTSAPNQTSRNSSQATLQSLTTNMVVRMRCTVSYNSWRCAPGPGYSSGRYRWKSA